MLARGGPPIRNFEDIFSPFSLVLKFILKRSFLCLTDGVCGVENALREIKFCQTMVMIVGELKEEKENPLSRGRNRTYVMSLP